MTHVAATCYNKGMGEKRSTGVWVNPDELLTIRDVAEMTCYPEATVRAWKTRGQLPEPVLIIGNKPIWTKKQFVSWMPPGKGMR